MSETMKDSSTLLPVKARWGRSNSFIFMEKTTSTTLPPMSMVVMNCWGC